MACTSTPTTYKVLPKANLSCPEEAGVLEVNDDDTYCCTSENTSSEKYIRALREVYSGAQVVGDLPPNLVDVMGWIMNHLNHSHPKTNDVIVNIDHVTTVEIVKLAIMTRSTATIKTDQNEVLYTTDHVRLFSKSSKFAELTEAIHEAGGVIRAEFFLETYGKSIVSLVEAKQIEVNGNPQIPVNIAELIGVVYSGVNPNPMLFKLNRRFVVKLGTSTVTLVSNLVRRLPKDFGRIDTVFASSSQETSIPTGYELVHIGPRFFGELSESLGADKVEESGSVKIDWKHVRIFFKFDTVENKHIRMTLVPKKNNKRKLDSESSVSSVSRKSRVTTCPSSASSNGASNADFLLQNGFVVVPTAVFADPQRKIDFLAEASKFQEFNEGLEKEKYVQGGFAALGNPSSFHNPVVRKYRQWIHSIVVKEVFRDLIQKYDKPTDWKLDHIIGRMLIRVKGETPSKESWHRDEASPKITGDKKKNKEDMKYFGDETIDDKVFGGWLNLDAQSQFFSCIRESHLPDSLEHRGFHKFKPEEAKQISKSAKKTRVEIPPGSILVFFENIIHEVSPSRAKYTMARLFTAFRLTRFDKVRPKDLLDRLNDQAPIMLKSGQEPHMYPSTSKNYPPQRVSLEAWSMKSIIPKLLTVYKVASGKDKGDEYTIIADKVMKSLREYNMTLYDPYTPGELKMYSPAREWRVLEPGSDNVFVEVSL